MSNNYKRVETMLYNYKKTKAEIKILIRELEILENEVIEKAQDTQKLKNKIRLKEIEIDNIDDALLILNEREIYIIKEYYINKRLLRMIADDIHVNENYASELKHKIINKLTHIIL